MPARSRAEPLSESFAVIRAAADPEYGYSEAKPIKVGGLDHGPARERLFLSQLAGSKGEPVTFQRIGSCCPFETPNGFMGTGMLDQYLVSIEGDQSPRVLYINMYDFEEPLVPSGFSAKSR